MYNRAIILGRLGQDPEIKYTQNQTAVCNFSVATTENRKVDNGYREETEWHKVVVWGKSAENCCKYLSKGSIAMIDGRIKTRSWEKKDGTKAYVTEIHAINVQFVKTNKDNQQSGSFSDPLDQVPF